VKGVGLSDLGARVYAASGDAAAWLVLAPGAGAGHGHPFMVAFGRGLAARGLHVVSFDFSYVASGRRVPDSNAVLEARWVSMLTAVREEAGADAPIFAGGKSMGGRIASQVAARGAGGVAVSGLVFLGYPLHPPGKPVQRRTAHWPDVREPALFVQGSRDPFASPEELRTELTRYGGPVRTLIIVDGDHSFKVPRRSGRTQDAIHDEIQDVVADWVRGIVGSAQR
jgi:uncharacterized protein